MKKIRAADGDPSPEEEGNRQQSGQDDQVATGEENQATDNGEDQSAD
jgi:hypothetical protein